MADNYSDKTKDNFLDKIKGWLVALGGFVVLLLGLIIGRRSANRRGMGRNQGTDDRAEERKRTAGELIQRGEKRSRRNEELVERSADRQRDVAESIQRSRDAGNKLDDIFEAVETRGSRSDRDDNPGDHDRNT